VTPTPLELAAAWRAQADAYERDGQPGAVLLRRVATELEANWEGWWHALLDVATAAGESGYSEDRLRELCRQDQLRHVRRGARILIRRCDLPRHPTAPEHPAIQALAGAPPRP